MTRVLAHAHSTWSYDGELSLEQWVAIARERSCGAVLLAEHEESGWTADRYAAYLDACRRVSDGDVRLVPGVEFNQSGYHVLCYGLASWPIRPSSAEALANAVHMQGCVLCLAHPSRYRWTFPASILDAMDAIEIWNSSWVSDGNLGPHPRTLSVLGARESLAGQDVHKRRHLSNLYLNVAGDDPVAAIREGTFEIEYRGRAWSRDRLRHVGARGWLQRGRTRGVHAALSGYRWARRQKRRLRQALAPAAPVPVEATRGHAGGQGRVGSRFDG